MWELGNIDGYEYQVKRYEEGSEFGINGGKISKLFMKKDGIMVVEYDRCWGKRPKAAAEKAAYEKLLARYN